MAKAYELLTDPVKRLEYDSKFGRQSGRADVFESLFGMRTSSAGQSSGPSGAAPSGPAPAKRRGEDVVFPMRVKLEELYNGALKRLRLSKTVMCRECNGYAQACRATHRRSE